MPYKDKNKRIEYEKEYYRINKERLSRRNKQYYLRTSERSKERAKKWRDANLEKSRKILRESMARQRVRNPQKFRERDKIYKLLRKLKQIPADILNRRIRLGIHKSLLSGKCGRHWEGLVGYTIYELKEHLEKQFTDGMNWENIGQWHIDHIVPLSAHNFNTPEDIDFKRAWALSNLRPLWAKENLVKGAKLSEPFQPSLALQIIS